MTVTDGVGRCPLGANGGMFRHSIERMDPSHYLSSSYYEHWLTGVTTLAVEAGAATADELDRRAGGHFPLSRPSRGVLPDDVTSHTEPRFAVGEAVRVREWHPAGHTRAPRYVQGKRGTVVRVDGASNVPDIEAHGGGFVSDPIYSVRFMSNELWGDGGAAGEVVHVELFELPAGGVMTADHHHHPAEPAPIEARIAAIEAVLVQKGILDIQAVDEIVRHFEHNLGPMNGAKVVARAWVDSDYKPRKLLAEMGTVLSDDVEIRVWDSSAEARYLVLPMRPDGTENLSEEELATRDRATR